MQNVGYNICSFIDYLIHENKNMFKTIDMISRSRSPLRWSPNTVGPLVKIMEMQRLKSSGQTQVPDAQIQIPIDQNVFRLQISMHNVLLMHEL